MKVNYIIIILIILLGCKNSNQTKGDWSLVDIPSPSLGSSLFKKTTTNTIGVYLPSSYNKNKGKRYPVLYFLEGYGNHVPNDGYACWIIDSLINKEFVSEMIFVDISGCYLLNGSFYENSIVSGNWKDYIVKDVVGFIDENYRTIPNGNNRVLAGHSMGGSGVLSISMEFPEFFKNVYSMSPGLFDEPGLINCQMFYKGGTVNAILNLVEQLKLKSKKDADTYFRKYINEIDDWRVEFTIAYGIAFAPDIAKAPYFDYPYFINGTDTILDENIWKKWENGFGNISSKIKRSKNELNKLNYLNIECGFYDEFNWIPTGTEYFHNILVKEKIPHQLICHNGNHGNKFTYLIRNNLIPFAEKAFNNKTK